MFNDRLIQLYVNLTNRLRSEVEGATAVEYGLMVALIAAVIIVSVTALGSSTSSKFSCVATKVAGTATGNC